MQKELLKFIIENNLSPFNNSRTPVKTGEESIFKTRDAKSVHNRVVSKISEHFFFSDTSSLIEAFYFTDNISEIKRRQEFFKNVQNLKNLDNSFLSEIKTPERSWTPKYDIVAVTANEKTFVQLKELGCPVKFITSAEDTLELENCDIVQAVDCEDFDTYLEQLNQAIFIKNAEDVYLERSIGKSPLANPFILNARKPEDRDTVIRMFKAYLNWATSIAQTDPRYDRMIDYQGLTRKILHGLEISSPIPFVHLDVSPRTIQRELKILEARLRKGESLRLVCWCHPLPCHTEIVRDYLLKRLIAKNLN